MTLKELRQQSGLTVKEVADKLGVTRNAVTNYECGIRVIGLQQVLVLAELYNCTEREVIDAQLKSIDVRSSD